MKKGQQRTSANHIARINIFVSNIMHKSCLSPAQPRKVTFLPDALKLASLASLLREGFVLKARLSNNKQTNNQVLGNAQVSRVESSLGVYCLGFIQ